MSPSTGLLAMLVLFPVYLLYTGKFKTYVGFMSAGAQAA